MRHEFLKLGEVVYRFDHLRPLILDCPVVFKNGRDKTLKIAVDFSDHCYSESYENPPEPGDQDIWADGVRWRIFNEIRYKDSHMLPDLIRALPAARINFTSHDNYVYETMIHIERVEYAVFFRLWKRRKDGHHLVLKIESAYRPYELVPVKKRPQNLRFMILARQIHLDEPIRVPPR